MRVVARCCETTVQCDCTPSNQRKVQTVSEEYLNTIQQQEMFWSQSEVPVFCVGSRTILLFILEYIRTDDAERAEHVHTKYES